MTTGMMVQLVLCLVLEVLNQTIALSLSYCMQTITNTMTSASHADVLFHRSAVEKEVILFICLHQTLAMKILLFPILLALVQLVLRYKRVY